jgi:hypothetical protein
MVENRSRDGMKKIEATVLNDRSVENISRDGMENRGNGAE